MGRRLFSKILSIFLILIILLSAAAYFFAKPILLHLANKELHKIFKESSVAELRITQDFIEFQDIEINSYDIKVEKTKIYYSLRSIFSRKADFDIKDVSYNKFKIGDVTGKIELKDSILNIRPILLSFLGGSVKGEFALSLDQDLDYSLTLLSHGLEIKKLVDEMNFNEKFDMTGRMEGKFYLSGKGQEIKDIKGDFYTDASGGVLVIKDKTFLENVARQSNQSLDIIVESFRNYNYNNGMIKLGMESGNLTMDMRLDGIAGKRSLTVVLHDFKKGKDGL